MTGKKPIGDAPHPSTAVSSPMTETRFAHRPWLLALVLVIITVVAYLPTLHDGFIWDDDLHVTENANLRSAHGLHQIWFAPMSDPQYYPLQLTSFWIEYHLWGLKPFGYHAVNVLLHALNAVLLWIVLQQLEIPGAWLAAAVFAVHPVQVESVAWVSELKSLLSATFYLGALLAFFRFRPPSGEAPAGSPRWRFHWLAVGLFLCALLSKTVACSLPAVVVLLLWWKRGRVDRQDIKVLSPMFLLGITFGLTTVWLEKHRVGAIGPEWSLSFIQRCLLAGRALWFYAGKLFWPHPLIFIYPHWEIDPAAWWQYLFPATAVAVFVALWSLRRRIGRGALVAVLCFAGTLMPALGFFDVYPFRYSYVADHFQYLASIGLISLGVSAGTAICKRAGQQGREFGAVVAAIVLLLLGAATWRQGHIYRDLETLWRHTVTRNPSAWMAHNNLGVALMQLDRIPEAIGQYEQALRIKPDYVEAHTGLGAALAQMGKTEEAIQRFQQALRINPDYAEAHYNLGNTLAQTGKIEEAIGQYEQALRINPDYADAHNNLGVALARTGREAEAIEHYEQALRIKPDFAGAHYNLGIALVQTGKIEEAIQHYEQALQINPDYAEAHTDLGVVLARTGRVAEAIEHYEQALRIKPDYAEAHNNLGVALLRTGTVPEAIGQYEQALRIKPDFAEAHYDLGVALARAGRVPEAIEQYEQALRIKPDFAEAHYDLGVALARTGRVPEAIGQYEQALRIKPDYADAHNNLGITLAQTGKVDDAIAHFEQALRIKPDFADAHYNLGVALQRMGRVPEAIEHYERALRIKPNFAEAHYNLGVALEKAGRVPEAVSHYEQALRVKPDFTQAQSALARLQPHQ